METPITQLFVDGQCGPCMFFARVTAGLARVPVAVHTLDGREADRRLAELPEPTRYGYFHLVEHGRIRSGPDAMPAWVGLFGGPTAERVAEHARPVDRLLRSVYNRFWEHRRVRGCAAQSRSSG